MTHVWNHFSHFREMSFTRVVLLGFKVKLTKIRFVVVVVFVLFCFVLCFVLFCFVLLLLTLILDLRNNNTIKLKKKNFADIWNTSQEDYCILFNKRVPGIVRFTLPFEQYGFNFLIASFWNSIFCLFWEKGKNYQYFIMADYAAEMHFISQLFCEILFGTYVIFLITLMTKSGYKRFLQFNIFKKTTSHEYYNIT